ncbi:uncharacterized protein [Prorops nasuta]|uniref:uncharacterized protein n=1 Tax=Prorops nasuta TaxID=863751 RepID=UPI0034CDE34D
MLLAILCCAFLGTTFSNPIANVYLSPLNSLPLRQFHTQDNSGAYQYAFTGPHHAKTETSSNGLTQGGYSYIDANGMLQTVTYTADDKNGFRVSASNLPQPPKNELQDTPEVSVAKRHHLEELQKSQLREQQNYQDQNILNYKILSPTVGYNQLQKGSSISESSITGNSISTRPTKNPFLLSRSEADKIEVPKPDPSLSRVTGAPQSTLAPSSSLKSGLLKVESGRPGQNSLEVGKFVTVPGMHRAAPMPAAYVLPVLPYRLLHSSLHHMQDSLGQYDYSYTGDSSAKTETRSLDGTTRGAYSYIDPNGILQQVHYIADHNGFRVLATNLPEAK